MEHIAALLMIVGCSADLRDCRELPAPTPIFETQEECDALLPETRDKYAASYPRVLAKCIYLDPALEYEDAELVWDVNPDGTLYAEITPLDTAVASSERRDRLPSTR